MARRLRPRIAVPIHWGTFFPIGLKRIRPGRLTDPPHEFVRYVRELAPEVDVHVLPVGGSVEFSGPWAVRPPGEPKRGPIVKEAR